MSTPEIAALPAGRPAPPLAAPALTVRSVRVPDPGVALIDLLPDPDGFSWVRRGEGLVAWGRAAGFDGDGPDRFTAATSWWADVVNRTVVRDRVGRRGSGLVGLGSFAFADDAAAAGSTGRSVLIVPEVVIGHRDGTWWVTTVAAHGRRLPQAPLLAAAQDVSSPGALSFADGALTSGQWEGIVAATVTRIAAGAADKVVLARALDVHAEHPIDARWALRRLAGYYPSCYTYAVDGLIGATPELLVRLDGRLATSRVLAGTIRRSGSPERDEARAGSLSRSSKDLEEHEYAVASVASALAPYCTAINVPESPFVLHLPNVMHLATEITGVVADGATALTLIAALHPTAAVCGTPREAAAATIAELEGMNRERYAGPVGWLSGNGDGEWGIALRGGQLNRTDPRRIRLIAGCGIVAGSNPVEELAESNAKLVPMRDALAD
ncbi:MAG: isochorismate synthase [bacterium]